MEKYLCIIAVHVDSRYHSLRCHTDDQADVAARLRRQASNEHSARRLIDLGGTAMTRTEGLSIDQHPPIVHTSPAALAIYAMETHADTIHVYEQQAWSTIPLSHAVAKEALTSA